MAAEIIVREGCRIPLSLLLCTWIYFRWLQGVVLEKPGEGMSAVGP